jgi:hypothetical protein
MIKSLYCTEKNMKKTSMSSFNLKMTFEPQEKDRSTPNRRLNDFLKKDKMIISMFQPIL